MQDELSRRSRQLPGYPEYVVRNGPYAKDDRLSPRERRLGHGRGCEWHSVVRTPGLLAYLASQPDRTKHGSPG